MKQRKRRLYIIVISIVCMVLGAFCIGIGLAKGGDLRYLHVGKDTVSWWPFHGNIGVGVYVDDNTDDGNKEKWEESLSDISSLTLEVAYGDVKIQRGSENKLSFRDIDRDDVTLEQADGQLTIRVENERVFDGSDEEVVVTLTDRQYENIRIVNQLGDIDIKDVYAKHMDIDEKMGDISLKNIMCADLLIEQSAGDIDVEGQLKGNSVIRNSMGDIDVKIEGRQSDYRYKVKNSLGDTEIQEREYEGMCDIEEGNPSSSNYVQIHSKMGDIELAFRQ